MKLARWQPLLNTVNVVIFAMGIFLKNVGKTFHVRVIFTILSLHFLHKGIRVLFPHGSTFREEDKSAKKRKLPPHENFHVYSTCFNSVHSATILYPASILHISNNYECSRRNGPDENLGMLTMDHICQV